MATLLRCRALDAAGDFADDFGALNTDSRRLPLRLCFCLLIFREKEGIIGYQ
jgi:hypothetical protein